MLLPQQLGLKVYHADITATDNVAVSLKDASILGGIPSKPAIHGCVVIESALGADADGIPHKVKGAAAEINLTTGIISVTVQFSASITRDVRVAILIKE
jgi:hypothetical protein